ncbi:PhzF family phenazine biosynthesis protein [Abyssibius alkaniclasticus]|uniref:PhzF family phenazine biosynthesis protein n=1 Tax=Abyssibius alkaniclasticus TaxID=2881234 RepID=UPI0023640DE4|nr:PhzF family phenazine biosynthesis protein [Abyssibius alkaniclasticus]UPH72639.1 PhzF family phenazine biosynthesis protein [Abyssibius alkaniclasticus]
MRRRFVQCDVFSAEALRGNGLAVVVDGDGLSDEVMQRFAAWTNLAETTFLQKPQDPKADYRIRIFTPSREMPFAGHPTLGSCAVWLDADGVPKQAGLVRQECVGGIVEIDQTGPVPAFLAPVTLQQPMPDEDLQAIENALGLDTERVVNTVRLNNGPIWNVLELASAADVLAVESARVRWPNFQSIGLIGAYPAGQDCEFEVRMLAPSSGMSEDPITGSLNAALAHWLQAQGRLAAPIVVGQGQKIGRLGRVFINPVGEGQVYIGGQTHILIRGTVAL